MGQKLQTFGELLRDFKAFFAQQILSSLYPSSVQRNSVLNSIVGGNGILRTVIFSLHRKSIKFLKRHVTGILQPMPCNWFFPVGLLITPVCQYGQFFVSWFLQWKLHVFGSTKSMAMSFWWPNLHFHHLIKETSDSKQTCPPLVANKGDITEVDQWRKAAEAEKIWKLQVRSGSALRSGFWTSGEVQDSHPEWCRPLLKSASHFSLVPLGMRN